MAGEWGDAALGPARYVSDAGWDRFADYLRTKRDRLGHDLVLDAADTGTPASCTQCAPPSVVAQTPPLADAA